MNSTKDPSYLFQLPPEDLPLNKEVITFMHDQGYKNLGELLPTSTTELLSMEGFGYRCLLNLYQFLELHGQEHLLREA